MAQLNGEKDPGTKFSRPGRMAGATLDLESLCEIHCDHQQRARNEHLNVFHDRSQHRGTRDKTCTERQEDSSIAMRKNAFTDAPPLLDQRNTSPP